MYSTKELYRMPSNKTDFPEFRNFLYATKLEPNSIGIYCASVRRILNAVPDMTEENLTEYLYTLGSGPRANLRAAWKHYAVFMANQKTPVPKPAYRGKGLKIAASVKQVSVDGLHRHHASRRQAKQAKLNPRHGRIMLQTTDGTTFVGDVDEMHGRILLDRAVIMQSEGVLAKLPGRVSIPAARESYRVLVPSDAYLGPK
jgi:hypothetical protein